MASQIPFISTFICLLVPVYALLIVILRRRIESKQIVYLVFAGVGTRFLYIALNIFYSTHLISDETSQTVSYSPILATVAVFLLIYIYFNVLIKALVRQSEIVSRFFLDSLPSQQLGADLEFRQQIISADSMRSKKADLLSQSLQLGGMEGVLRWLAADVWLIIVGTILISLAKFEDQYQNLFTLNGVLAMLGDFSSKALLLVIAGMVSAFPIVRYLSLGSMAGGNQHDEIVGRDLEIVVLVAVMISLFFIMGTNGSGYIESIVISCSFMVTLKFFLYRRNLRSKSRFCFERNGDNFEEVSKISPKHSAGICKIDLPKPWMAKVGDQLFSYLEKSGIVCLPNVVTAIEVGFSQSNNFVISYGNIKIAKKSDLEHLYLSCMEPRVLKTLGSFDPTGQVFETNTINFSKVASLRPIIKEFINEFRDFYPSPVTISGYLNVLAQSGQLGPAIVSRLDVEKKESISQIFNLIYLFGYSFIPMAILHYVLDMVLEERDEGEIVKTLISELIKESPDILAGSDNLFRALSVDKEISGHNDDNLIERILVVAADLEERGLAPLLLIVGDIGNSNLLPLAEDLKNRGIDFRLLDSSVKLSRTCFPLGVV